MTPDAFKACCLSLPGATHVVQWGGAAVFKVGGKIFAIAGSLGQGEDVAFSFKASDMAYALLIEQGLARPAPYLARAKWVRLMARDSLPDTDLVACLSQAHALVAARLTRTARRELGLALSAQPNPN